MVLKEDWTIGRPNIPGTIALTNDEGCIALDVP